MKENRVSDTIREIGGKAQEGVGRAVDESAAQGKGITDQIQGTAQDLYGRVRDSASTFADAASQSASDAHRSMSSYESTLRNTIETQPYLAVLVALGIGWLVGRLHQPL
jgi:uncharacterized protein YjbJ (UPF0337 family)